MRLRLRMAVGNRPPEIADHAGPVIHIGRDPAGEVVFQAPDIDTVSWHHARIDLTPQGAILRDLGSTNGTFVNNQRIADATRLEPGDEIRLGQTGPALHVVDLNLAPAPVRQEPRPVPAAARPGLSPQVLLAAGGLLGLVLIIGGIWWWSSRPNSTQQQRAQGPTVPEPRPTTPAILPPPTASKPPATGPNTTVPVAVAPPRFLGRYIQPARAPPSILLERQRNGAVWGRLSPDNGVQADQYLMSLPGYRSLVQLDSGVRLTLWGNVPAFSPIPPVLESVVVLLPPGDPSADASADLNLLLDRGRVHLANSKKSGSVRIRILFRNEKWDLTLPDGTSEAVIELSGIAAPNTPRDIGPINEIDLFVKGTAELKVRNRTVSLPNKSWVTWSSANQEASGPVEVPQLPPWWTGSLNLKDDLVAESVLVLTEFHEVLRDSGSVLRAVVEEMGKKPDDAAVWSMGMLFLAALDALPQVVDVLVEAKNEFARLAARMALQQWISRSPDNQRELERFLREQKIYSPDKAQLVVRLLRGFSPDALKKPETYAQLIGHLNHSDFIVRDLAWWHLAYLDEAKDLSYDPAAPAEKREPAVAELKKRLPDGQVPKRQGKPAK